MAQVVHVRDDVILNVAEIEADFGPRRDGILLRAAFGEAFNHVRFAAEEPHERHDLFATVADELEEGGEVIMTDSEDLIFDGIGFNLNSVDDGDKSIDYIVTVGE